MIREKFTFLINQIIITGINALVGFIILRGMPKVEYAVYTIVFSILAVFTNITNIGITPAMNGIGGKIWKSRREMQALLNTALLLRHQLGWWFAGPFIFYCAWQFWETGLNWPSIIILIGLMLFIAWVQLKSALYSIVLQLNHSIRGLQQNELRFVLVKITGVSLILFLYNSVLLVVGWISICFLLNWLANKKLANNHLEQHNQTNDLFKKDINDIIRSNFFRTVYWSFEGQISILLCTLFATTESIADIGALGRIGVYFAVFQSFILNYSLPALSKLQERESVLGKGIQILRLTLVVIVPILMWSILHPRSLIWVLGPKYTALEQNLFAYILALSIGQIATVIYQVCAAKAWIQMNRHYVPIAIFTQAILIYSLDLSKIENVILFLGVNNAFFLIFNALMFYFSYKRQPPITVLH